MNFKKLLNLVLSIEEGILLKESILKSISQNKSLDIQEKINNIQEEIDDYSAEFSETSGLNIHFEKINIEELKSHLNQIVNENSSKNIKNENQLLKDTFFEIWNKVNIVKSKVNTY